MTLGEKLVQARTALGLTQQQVAGEHMTRNMLSRLEHDAVSPSVGTLKYLADVLQVSMGWLLNEPPQTADGALEEARGYFRAEDHAACLELLLRTPAGDTEEGKLLSLRCRLRLSLQALQNRRPEQAAAYAEKALEQPGLYASPTELSQLRMVLARCAMELQQDPTELLQQITAGCKQAGLEEGRRLLLARSQLMRHNTQAAERELWAITELSPAAKGEYLLLRGRLELEKTRSRDAMLYLRQAEQEALNPLQLTEVYTLLEQCCTEQEDYRSAYLYATKRLKLLEKNGT